jgi:hypothetical protein
MCAARSSGLLALTQRSKPTLKAAMPASAARLAVGSRTPRAWSACVAGYSLRAARALDGGATVTSNEGLALLASLGVGTAY